MLLDTNLLLSGHAYPASVPGTLPAALRLGLAQTLVTGDKALLTLRDRFPSAPPQSAGRSMAASERAPGRLRRNASHPAAQANSRPRCST